MPALCLELLPFSSTCDSLPPGLDSNSPSQTPSLHVDTHPPPLPCFTSLQDCLSLSNTLRASVCLFVDCCPPPVRFQAPWGRGLVYCRISWSLKQCMSSICGVRSHTLSPCISPLQDPGSWGQERSPDVGCPHTQIPWVRTRKSLSFICLGQRRHLWVCDLQASYRGLHAQSGLVLRWMLCDHWFEVLSSLWTRGPAFYLALDSTNYVTGPERRTILRMHNPWGRPWSPATPSLLMQGQELHPWGTWDLHSLQTRTAKPFGRSWDYSSSSLLCTFLTPGLPPSRPQAGIPTTNVNVSEWQQRSHSTLTRKKTVKISDCRTSNLK